MQVFLHTVSIWVALKIGETKVSESEDKLLFYHELIICYILYVYAMYYAMLNYCMYYCISLFLYYIDTAVHNFHSFCG